MGYIHMIADLHTHTIACGHGFSTVTEVMQEAADKGLSAIGLTEHGIGYPGSVSWSYFNTYRDIPREFNGVKVYCGTEANYMNLDGTLDFTMEQLSKLDIVIASCHTDCSPTGSRDEVTNMLIQGLKNPYVDILGHPDSPKYPIDVEAVVQATVQYHKAIEINDSSPQARPGSEPICRELLRAVKKYGALISINSDAHYHKRLGIFDYALPLVEEAGIPETQIINTSMERLQAFLDSHHKA